MTRSQKISIAAQGVTVLCLLGIVAWVSATITMGTRTVPLDPAEVARGSAIYAQHCAACHGANLEGQPNWTVGGPDSRLPAPPQNASGHTWMHSDAQLFRIVRDGMQAIEGPNYASNMPAFGAMLDESEIRAVLAFIESSWPEALRERQPRD